MTLYGVGAAVRNRRKPRTAGGLSFCSPFDQALNERLQWTTVVRSTRNQTVPEPLTKYENDPVGFCRDILGIEPWSKQQEILEAVRDNERVSVRACYSSGKTFIAACLSLWWIYTRRPAMVITTAPTGRQVKALLWREIRKLARRAKRRLGGRLLQTQLHIAEDWWGMGFASDAPNSVAGLHEARNVLFIEDEAAGMLPHVVEGFEGITASENSRHLKIGNPICTSGPFLDSHMTPGEMERWLRISIDATQTPNYLQQKVVVPGLVTHAWVEDKRKRWGENSPLWKTKVLGEFFLTAGEKLIPEDWVLQSHGRWFSEGGMASAVGKRILGVDVASGGADETVLYMRQGRVCWLIDRWQIANQVEQAAKIAELAREHEADQICVDATGLGKGLSDILCGMADQGELCEVIPVVLSVKPFDSETYAKRVDELNWLLRCAMDPSNPESLIINPAEGELSVQLSVQGWGMNDDFKIRAESKRELKKRGVDSPDDKDSLMLTFAGETEVAFAWA